MSLFSLIVGEELLTQKWVELHMERKKLTREYCETVVLAAFKRKLPEENWDKPDELRARQIALCTAELYGYYRGRMDAKEDFLKDL
jgi:hypothetical protein